MSPLHDSTYFVPPHVWRNLITASILRSKQTDVRGLAFGITSALHNQHTGITPALSYRLAEALIQRSSSYQQEPAKSLITRLREALKALYDSQNRLLEYPENEQYALILRTSVNYVIFKLVAPIIETICEKELGATLLFSDDPRAPVTLREYEDYERDLDAAFLNECQGITKFIPDTFWQDRALTLINLTAQRIGDTVNLQPDTILPDIDIFLHLHTPPDDNNNKNRRIQIPIPSQQVDPRLYESGVDGIAMTTSIDELHRRLYSEFQYPYAIQMDRIFNTGYMVSTPPPRPIQQRDILIMAMFPDVFEPTVTAFLKTTWFNFSMYMTDILRSNKLDNSQMRWIEGDKLYRVRQDTLQLNDIQHLDQPPTPTLPDTYRHHYLRSLQWFPDYMDDKKHFQRLEFDENATATHPHYPMLEHWFAAAWDKQIKGDNHDHIEPLQLQAYRFVHLMIFTPPENVYNDFGFLRQFQGLRPEHVSITTLPVDKLTDPDWTYKKIDVLHQDWYNQDINTFMQHLSGVLIEKWITGIVKEMQRG